MKARVNAVARAATATIRVWRGVKKSPAATTTMPMVTTRGAPNSEMTKPSVSRQPSETPMTALL